LGASESDELTNSRNQVAQARRSIHTDISRNLYRCSEIRDSESRKNIGLRMIAVLTCFNAEFRKRTSFAFLPQSRPVEIHVDQIHKTQKKWNGAGTFRFLVTLKKQERCEKRRRRIARIELAYRL
jgi:hypothetical protein